VSNAERIRHVRKKRLTAAEREDRRRRLARKRIAEFPSMRNLLARGPLPLEKRRLLGDRFWNCHVIDRFTLVFGDAPRVATRLTPVVINT
jgi:hypothetical protein